MADTASYRGTGGERFKLRLATVIWFVLLVTFLLGLPVLFDVSWMVVAGIALLALVLSPIVALIVRLFRGQRAHPFGVSWLKAFFGTLFVLVTVGAAPIYGSAFLTSLRPMTVPTATLSNGTKTLVFQGMAHVGSEGFYKSVVYDIEKALVDGYVIFYEGVQGSPDGDAWFSKTLAGGGDLSTNYKTISDLCGLQFQLDYFTLLVPDMQARPDRHVAADVSTGDMKREYDRLMQVDPVFAAAEKDKAAEPADTGDGIGGVLKMLQGTSPEQQKIAGYLCRGFFTYQLSQQAAPDQMDKVVLDFRNRELAKRINAATSNLIYTTYGANHLPGLLADLQATDPAWEIKSLKWSRTIAAPEELEGKIQ